MAQYVIWYKLQLKAWVKRRSSWLQILGMILLALLVSQIHLPGVENTRVGICVTSEETAQRVLESLKTRDSIFEFQEYVSEEDMRQDIVSGVIECGFAFSGNIFSENDVQKNSVTYICTPFSAKGLVAQETFYAAFFETYSDRILIDSESKIYGKSDGEITKELLDKKQDYLQNNEMFQMDVIEALQKQSEEQIFGKVSPMRGVVGLFLFLILWMTQARRFENHGNGVAAALERRRRVRFEYLGCLSEATVPVVFGLFLILLSPENRGIIIEAGSLLLFVLVCSFWVLTVGRQLKNSTTFVAWTFTLILVQVVVCPVFVDLVSFVPAVKVIRWGFPLGWMI